MQMLLEQALEGVAMEAAHERIAASVFERILVPTDFSAASERAWSTAQRLAAALGAELVLTHVLCEADFLRGLEAEEREADAWSRHSAEQLSITPDPTWSQARVTAQEWAEDLLGRWAGQARAAGLKVSTVLRAGSPHREIVAAVVDHRADLVVLATRGRGGLPRLFYGSVADPVVRSAPCPVMTVRAS